MAQIQGEGLPLSNNNVFCCRTCGNVQTGQPVAMWCGCIKCDDPSCHEAPCPADSECCRNNVVPRQDLMGMLRNVEYDSARLETLSNTALLRIQCDLMQYRLVGSARHVTAKVRQDFCEDLIRAMNTWGEDDEAEYDEHGQLDINTYDTTFDDDTTFDNDPLFWSGGCKADSGKCGPRDDNDDAGAGMLVN